MEILFIINTSGCNFTICSSLPPCRPPFSVESSNMELWAGTQRVKGDVLFNVNFRTQAKYLRQLHTALPGVGGRHWQSCCPSRAVPRDACLRHPQSILCDLRGGPFHKPSAKAVTFLSSDSILPASIPGLCSCLAPAVKAVQALGDRIYTCGAATARPRMLLPAPAQAALGPLLPRKPLPRRGRAPCARPGQRASGS